MKEILINAANAIAENDQVSFWAPKGSIAAGVLFAAKAIPFILGAAATIMGILASYAIYRERQLKSRLHEMEIEEEEEARERKKKGLECRRRKDKIIDDD